MSDFPYLGHGIGLRPVHYQQVVAEHPAVDWLEVISENFMVPGGNPRRVLRAVRERYPVVMHGVSMSLGSVDPLREDYLVALEQLAADVQPAWISDHLCWSSFGGHSGHDLWPLPFTEESVAHVASRVQQVQERLRRPMLVENVSSYLQYAHATLTEWEFLAELTRRTGCSLLLDVNNIFVSAQNHGFDAVAFLEGIPKGAVGQIHLAGHSREGVLLIDTHDHPVCDEVWELYRTAIQRFGRISTLIEWDDQIPPLERLVAESQRAAELAASLPAKELRHAV
jgi:uncharacterized protein (UPF0276 family)